MICDKYDRGIPKKYFLHTLTKNIPVSSAFCVSNKDHFYIDFKVIILNNTKTFNPSGIYSQFIYPLSFLCAYDINQFIFKQWVSVDVLFFID